MRRASALLPPLLIALAASAAAGAAAAAGPQPAEWRDYDVLVRFTQLPRTYSCDELWYRLRDVLELLGARAYMTITPYHCGVQGGGQARSPSVEVQFELPLPLHGDAVRYAELEAVSAPVRLAPGAPRSLASADCELVRQLQDALLAALPVRVTAAEFRCTAPHESFTLMLTATRAAPPASAQAGTAAGAAAQP